MPSANCSSVLQLSQISERQHNDGEGRSRIWGSRPVGSAILAGATVQRVNTDGPWHIFQDDIALVDRLDGNLVANLTKGIFR